MRVLTLAYTSSGNGIWQCQETDPLGKKITKPKQGKIEMFWMTPVVLDSSPEACSGLGEEGNKSDFDDC